MFGFLFFSLICYNLGMWIYNKTRENNYTLNIYTHPCMSDCSIHDVSKWTSLKNFKIHTNHSIFC